MGRSGEHFSSNAATRAVLAGLCLVVLVLSGLAVFGAATVKQRSDRIEHSTRLNAAYGEARDAVASEEFWVTEYLLLLIPNFEELDPVELRRSHALAAASFTRSLERAGREGTREDRVLTGRLLERHARYLVAVQRIFSSVDAGDKRGALAVELEEIDPSFSFIEDRVEQAADVHRRSVARNLIQLDWIEERSFIANLIAFPLGMLLLGGLGIRLRHYRRDEHARLQTAALTDNLTGLANHRAFRERLQSEITRHRRSHAPLSLVLLDLDGLKQINDTHGHPMGDQQLKTLADRLGSSARESDGVFRIGGDEFAAILPDATASQALRYVQRLQAQLGEARATAGICELSDDITREDFIHHADQALLEAKRNQRDALVYTASLEPPAEPSDHHTGDRLAVVDSVVAAERHH